MQDDPVRSAFEPPMQALPPQVSHLSGGHLFSWQLFPALLICPTAVSPRPSCAAILLSPSQICSPSYLPVL